MWRECKQELLVQNGVKMEKAAYRRRKGQRKSYRPFSECVRFVQKLQLHTVADWKEYVRSGKKPDNIPSHPNLVFKDRGWMNWAEWLGTKMYTYEQAKEIVAPLNWLNGAVWKEQAPKLFPRPSRMPIAPDAAYGSSWEGWATFLGQESVRTRHPGPTVAPTPPTPTHRSFPEAMKLVSKLGLKSSAEYTQWRKTYPYPDLPWRPDEVYEDWLGWGPFLGNKPLPALMTDTSVLYVSRRAPDPGNVYQIRIEAIGKSEVMHKALKEGFSVVRMWKYDPTLRVEVQQVIDANASMYGTDHEYLVQNIHGLVADMFNLLVVV